LEKANKSGSSWLSCCRFNWGGCRTADSTQKTTWFWCCCEEVAADCTRSL